MVRLRGNPKSTTADLLFEIGTEELPAAYLPGLIAQLREEAAALFKAQHLSCNDVESFGTPRRLVLLVHGLTSLQHKPGEEVRGPSKQAAYDGQGKPTQALLGFLRSHGAAISQTKLVASPKGEYVYLTKPPTSTPTDRLLPTLLPQLIGKLRAPKTMRWDETNIRFARPIRWLLALYGTTPIRGAFGKLVSGSVTWVDGPKRPRRINVRSLDAYRSALKKAGTMLNHDDRRAWIEQHVSAIAKRSHGRIAPEMVQYGLLDEVTFLVERPVILAGAFDPRYLELPREVLLASTAKHQRVFAIESAGKLLPHCVAILEGQPGKPAKVRRVIERILNARLADSLMFLNEDRKRFPLDQMAQGLRGVTFHEKLGSMAQKTTRLEQLSQTIADAWRLSPEEATSLRRACQLAKADLVSTMVKEFPTLQGIVGKYYAKESGDAQVVADAIEEQYLPTGEKLPRTLIGSALAILDKYDTLAGYFSVGIEPTGDQDPFGLRRAAQGIVEVAWAIHRPLPLHRFFEQWQPLIAPAKPVAPAREHIHRYILERLYTFAWPKPAPSVDCIDAVLNSPCDDLIDVMDRIVSLQTLQGHPGLLRAAKVIERTRNILKGAPLRQGHVNPAQLQDPIEQRLWDLYRSNEERVVALSNKKSYTDATMLFGEIFFEPLHEFFDKVMVNVPDETLQQNRLALMKAIHTLYTERIADLSKLTVLQQQESR